MKLSVFLVIYKCCALQSTKDLRQGLQHLNLYNCRELLEVPSLAKMSSLIFLYFGECWRLTYIEGLECLIALKHNDLSGCTSIGDYRFFRIYNKTLSTCCFSWKESCYGTQQYMDRDNISSYKVVRLDCIL